LEIVNVFTVECDDEMEHEGLRIRETGITDRLGADLIGGSVYEVDPGKKLWPPTSITRTRNGSSSFAAA
jgi:hypothetical protein